ncbi:agmatinase [Desulfonema ishimotonii]|uniref:Agmatinase n=1 Tax=Desulfonema ishimotonii TaxID=45657 RepID=A0A401FS56_9BACT|nr:agmatinase [Desulfonema ishimotonii]GBC59794.1 agmatinase [Desulfonema ishimotonii]
MIKPENFIPFGGNEIQPTDAERARIVILPLCYEHAPSYGTGSEDGPYHLLMASEQLEAMDEETLINWGTLGIHTLPPLFPSGDPETAVMQMKRAAEKVLREKKFLLSLGGDHAISIGPVMAAAETYPGIGILQIDAHLDLRDEWNGSRYNHACIMRRIIEKTGAPVAQVGIRSFSPEEVEYVQQQKLRPFYAHDIDPRDDTWIGEVLCALPDTVYITVDLDGLDPSVIPGTGTPEPGGLTYRQLIRLIRAVGREKNVVAADINELAKIPGTQVSEFTAAKIATKLFVYCL